MYTSFTKTAGHKILVFFIAAVMVFGVMLTAAPQKAYAASGWDVGYKAPASGVVATMSIANDATLSGIFSMVKSSKWSINGTNWETDDIDFNILSGGDTLYIWTPYSSGTNTGINSSAYTTVLPNIEADVTVDIDPAITNAGNYFMYCYAYQCDALTSLDVPVTSKVTSVGDHFMAYYAYGCTELTELDAPDTSKLETITIGAFMANYAYGCTKLTELALPDLSSITNANDVYFMINYAVDCTALEALVAPFAPVYFAANNVNLNIGTALNGTLKLYTEQAYKDDWDALTESGKFLYINQIQSTDNVIATDVPIQYPVKVNNGKGGGDYTEGATVMVTAYDAQDGQRFLGWSVNSGGVTLENETHQGTSFTMPPNAVEVTANYGTKPDNHHSITVQNDGNGTATSDIHSAEPGAVVTLSATPAADYHFSGWQVVSGGVTINADNTFTMLDAAVIVKAIFIHEDSIIVPDPTNPPVPIYPTTSDNDSGSSSGGGGGGGSGTAASAGPVIKLVSKPSSAPGKTHHDNLVNGKIDVRITATTSAKDNYTGSTVSASAKAVRGKFDKFYSNVVMDIILGQKGSFSAPVHIAAKLDPKIAAKIDPTTLYFYSYDSATNTYRQIKDPNCWVDKNGYLHFDTELAGDIIISNGPLARK
ncbi:hypothetical protein FACS1894191_6930 [Clostridia bacterium]|nr:hypothetical protein FACS1894191_6930 [Clostridia bacterium]